MKTAIHQLVILLILSSCNGNKTNKASIENNVITESIYGDKILEIPINLENQTNKKLYLDEWLSKNYFKSAVNYNIDEVNNLDNYLTIFKINLEGNYPSNLNKFYSLIYIKAKNKTFLIPIEYNQLYKIDNEIMIGGIYSYREFEYYLIYKLNNDFFEIALDTRKNGDSGLKTGYFRFDECYEYKPNRFIQNYNKKEKKITFTGTILSYCKPNFDRNLMQKEPLKKEKVKIEYNYVNNKWLYNKNSIYTFW